MPAIVLKEPQKIAIPFLRENPRAALWGSCGIGKTTSALFVADALLLTGEATGPTLVAAPARVARDVWTTDAAKWDQFKHLRVVHIGGTPKQRVEILRRRPWADIYTISYELLPWLVEYFTDKWPFRQVIADESDNLKGFRLTTRASAVQDPTKPLKSGHSGKRAHAIGRVAHTLVKRWINLTGTPAGNGLKDLWGQTWYLDRGERLGRTHGAFMQRWFRTNQYTGTIEPLPYADAQIHAALKDICLTL
ncbi:MAG: SNF2-related protein, partial [Hyphomicrobiales bacterium]